MRDHYDFSKMKGRKNPYTKYLKQPVTMRLDRDTVAYFKSMAEETGIAALNLARARTPSRHGDTRETLILLRLITLLGEALHDFESLRFAPLLADGVRLLCNKWQLLYNLLPNGCRVEIDQCLQFLHSEVAVVDRNGQPCEFCGIHRLRKLGP